MSSPPSTPSTHPPGAMAEENPDARRADPAAIAAAVQARLAGQVAARAGSGSSGSSMAAPGLDEHDFMLKVKRNINVITANSSSEVAFKCLALVHTLCSGVLDNPDEAKYRSFRAEQKRIKSELLSVHGGRDLLVLLGWRTRTENFQQEWFVPIDLSQRGKRMLEIGRGCVGEKKEERERMVSDREERRKREAEVERNRVARALDEARIDRERVAERSARERIARAAAAAAASAEAEAEAAQAQAQPQSQAQSTGDNSQDQREQEE